MYIYSKKIVVPPNIMPRMSPRSFLPSAFSRQSIQAANMSISRPWPMSPNMTAKRKGKVIMEKTAGLASRYRAMPAQGDPLGRS